MIYLDNGATTQPHRDVLTTYMKVLEKFYANPSAIHELGGTVNDLQEEARRQIARLLRVDAEEIIFTSGGTEGNNLAIKGIALAHRDRGNHIITTSVEHPSVYQACEALKDLGFRISYLPVDRYGRVSVEEVESAITEDTILVSIMQVNNEIGTIQPIEEIAERLQQYPKLFFHVDAVQGLGKVPLDIAHGGIDLCTFSGHKIHGVKGSGVLYVKQGTALFPLFHGGSQEYGLRAGTEHVAGNVAFSRALRLILEKEAEEREKLYDLRHRLIEGLESLEGVEINSPRDGAPHIVHLSVPGLKPEVVIHALYEEGIVVSTQSACSSKRFEKSRVLMACGHSEARASSGIRITLSYDTTEEEIDFFLERFKRIIKELRNILE